MKPTLLLACVALLALAACEAKPDKKDEVKFEPGPMKVYELESLGCAITAPDNLELKQGKDKVEFVAPGFPTLTVAVEASENDGVGSKSSQSSSTFSASMFIPGKTFTCNASDIGKHGDLIAEICRTIDPVATPHMKSVKCDNVEGFVPADVLALWESLQDKTLDCARLNDTPEQPNPGLNIGFNYNISEGSTSRTHWASPTWNDEGKACFAAVWEEVKLELPEGVTDGKAECSATYSRY